MPDFSAWSVKHPGKAHDAVFAVAVAYAKNSMMRRRWRACSHAPVYFIEPVINIAQLLYALFAPALKHVSQFLDAYRAVSYTHLTLPTNREV